MIASSDSLSVVLPVRNCAAALPRRILDLLDLLPEITSSFELLIVDCGSTDQTDEVAFELSCTFPQVRFSRVDCDCDSWDASLALYGTRGDLIAVLDQSTPINASGLRQMWDERHELEREVSTSRWETTASLLERPAWAASTHREEAGRPLGCRLLRRHALPHPPRTARPHRPRPSLQKT